MQFIYTMGMTSRRVKRGKRSKKYLHHGCRKTSRRRYTRIQRIQRGGKMHEVCKSTGFFKKSGITIQYDDETQMYTIGSKPYAQLSDRYINVLNVLKQIFTQNLPMNGDGYINLNQSQFDQFAEQYCKDKSTDECKLIKMFGPPAPASDAERVSRQDIKDAIKLIRTDVGGSPGLNVQFYGVMHVLTLGKPLVINIPADPKSRQNPITQLRFTVDGDNINVDFVLKNNVFSYCAMARYDDPHFIDISNLNLEVPYIRITILFGSQLRTEIIKNNEVSIGDQIIPTMDNIQRYANDCATDAERMQLARKYYEGNVRAAHINDKTKAAVLKLFIPASLSSTMSKLSIGTG